MPAPIAQIAIFVPMQATDNQKALLRVAGVFALLTAVAILAIDKPVARALENAPVARAAGQVLVYVDYVALFWLHKWGSAYVIAGAAGVAAAISLFVPRWRPHAFRVLARLVAIVAMHICIRLLVTEIKLATGRLRPVSWIGQGSPNATFLYAGSSAVGFPSGHVTQFASVLMPALLMWNTKSRVLRCLAITVPLAVGLVRILQNAHFVSDVTGAISVCAVLSVIFSSLCSYIGSTAHTFWARRSIRTAVP
jgi:hypothetical protein